MKKIISLVILCTIIIVIFFTSSISYAQPYGKGVYGSNVPYGNQTSLSIATNGNVTIPIVPATGGVLATGISTITVTSTDVKGYKLYIRALGSTAMRYLSNYINTKASYEGCSSLGIMNWGYNTDGSVNFCGASLTDALIKSTATAQPSGEVTTVTYGINLDLRSAPGNYTVSIVYTAVPQTD